tara:strand:+ start:2186 stop:3286 length:1101 start_codon:yes stop_codon:yes gene_type:complete
MAAAAVYENQAEIDAAFAVVDEYLAKDNEACSNKACSNCGGVVFSRSANMGHVIQYCNVCDTCGCVAAGGFGQVDEVFYSSHRTSSNYKRIHQCARPHLRPLHCTRAHTEPLRSWHERQSQLLLCESRIPPEHFLQIAERICDGTVTILNKDVIRGVLRSLNYQLYIEKWLQIIQRITLIEPPKPGAMLLQALDDYFQELQTPFANFKAAGRKNFLNYNYVFSRLFAKLGTPQFSMFFPLIKSRAKLRALDETWEEMATALGWEITPLELVAPFAVKIEQPEEQLRRIREQVAFEASAGSQTKPDKTGFQRWDLRLLRELEAHKQRVQRRSSQPELVIQTPASSKRKFPSAVGAEPRRLLRSRPRR